jgi:hypothetical protein
MEAESVARAIQRLRTLAKERSRTETRVCGFGLRLAAWLGILIAASGCANGPERAAENLKVARSTQTGSSVDVLTRNYNYQRTGANTAETVLTTANVNPTQFGKLFSVGVDDQVYAQILFRSNLWLPDWGVTADVFFVATVNNTVYAFDAYTGQQYWAQNYTPAGARVTNNGDTCPGGKNFSGNTGIVGTPVIDPDTNTMYFVTRIYWYNTYEQWLHAVDIATGNDRYPASDISYGLGGLYLDPKIHNQRAALALDNGVVYVAWGTFCDQGGARGWVVGFDETSLLPTAMFPVVRTDPVPFIGDDGQGGGIWQAGGGIAIDDSGSVYAATGNGSADSTSNFGYSLIKLSPSSLLLQDFFTASALVPTQDTDFGSSGPVFLPNTNLVTVGSKEGIVYVMDSTNLGGFVPRDMQIPQKLPAVENPANRSTSHIHGSNVAWVGPDGSTYLYVWGENDYLRSYALSSTANQFYTVPVAVGPSLPPDGMPGGMMTLSSNGQQSGTGILWGTTPLQGDAAGTVVPGVLRAFNAETLALLWTSPDSWNFAKDNPPVVANGEVFLATFSNVVNVYGITQASPVYNGQIVNLRKRSSMLPAACVDVPYGTTDTTQLQTVSCNGSYAQDWQFYDTGYGWQIQRPALGMCMDIPNDQSFPGQAVQQAPCNGSQEQLFNLTSLQDGMSISPADALDYCVTFPNNSTVPGTPLILMPCSGVALVGDDSQAFTPVAAQLRKQNSGLPGMCVDVPWGTTDPDTQLQTYYCNNQEWQSWQVIWWPDGSNGIQRNGQNLCFDVPYGDAYEGAPVQQYPCNGGSSQEWIVWPRSNGYEILFNDPSNLCVDVPNNSNSPGQKLHLWSCNGTDAQVFAGFQPQIRKSNSGTAPGLCLDVQGGLGSLAACAGTATQNWQALPTGVISSTANGCLGYEGSGGFSSNMSCTPTPPGQTDPTNQWTQVSLSPGGSELQLTGEDVCMDAPWGWNTPAAVQLWSCNASSAQAYSQ